VGFGSGSDKILFNLIYVSWRKLSILILLVYDTF